MGWSIRRRRRAVPALTGAMLCMLALSGCVHRAPQSVHDDTAIISGHNTAHASASNARRTVLVEAAAIALDHGYRYFQVMTPIRPGANVTIRVYGKGDVDPHAANVYDANDIAAGKLQPAG